MGCFNVVRGWYNAHNIGKEGQGSDVVVTYTRSVSAGRLFHWSWAEAPHASEVSGRGESCVSLLNLLALNVMIGFFSSLCSEWFYWYSISAIFMLLLNLMCSHNLFLSSTCSFVMIVKSYSHTHNHALI